MTVQLGWYGNMPVGSFNLPGDTNEQTSYLSTNTGSLTPGGSYGYFFAGVNNSPGSTGVVVWNQTWVPTVADAAPPTVQPYGANPGMLQIGGNQPWTYPHGTLTLTATLDGEPVPGQLVLTLSLDPTYSNPYGNAAWDYVAPPACDFVGTPLTGDAPLTVQFTDLSTGPVVAWEWNFGDDQTSNLQNPQHEYAAVGTYDVSLEVAFPLGTIV